MRISSRKTEARANRSAEPETAARAREAFLVTAAQLLHRHGTPAHRLEDTLVACATAFGFELQVFATPGHTDDSACFALPRDGALVTGDTVLGEGSTLIAWPDGRLGPYLDSLKRLRDFAAAGHSLTLLPGHGPLVLWGLDAIDTLIAHRERRLQQVTGVLDEGASSVAEVISAVYGLPGPALHEVVVAQVQAQLEFLAAGGNARAADALHR